MPDFAVSAIIGAKGAEFLNTFRSMKSGLSSFGTAAKSAFERAIPGGRALSGVLHSMAGQVAIGNLLSRGVTAIGRQIASLPGQLEDFAARGQEIGRTASIIGTSAEAWQRLGYAAKITDTPIETLQLSMQRLNKNMADLTVGKGSLKDLAKFGPAGLAATIRGTHDTTEAMFLLADSIAATKDAQVRAAIAQSAFGKAGQQMLPMLELGRVGMQKLMAEADKYGSVLSNDVVKASGYFDDTLKRTRGTISAIKDSMYGYLMTALTPYLEKARDWLAANRAMIEQKIPEYIDKITNAAKWLWGAVNRVHETWDRLNKLANGHLARDILLVVAAWKGVRLAIDFAKAAQIAFGIVSAATGAAGAGGAAASAVGGAAETAIGAGAAKWAGKWGAPAAGAAGIGAGAMAIPVIGAAITAGSALLPMITNPQEAMAAASGGGHMKGGNVLTNLFTGALGLGYRLRGEKKSNPVSPEDTPLSNAGQKVDVKVLLQWLGQNPGIMASIAPPITGAQGSQYGASQ